jgi:hypothetical protein
MGLSALADCRADEEVGPAGASPAVEDGGGGVAARTAGDGANLSDVEGHGAEGGMTDSADTPLAATGTDGHAGGDEAAEGTGTSNVEGGSAAPDAIAGRDPCAMRAGLLFCDSFEAATTATPPSPWSTSIIGSGMVTIDSSSPAHSGARSVHVSDGDADYDTLLVLHDESLLPSPSGRLYVRTFIRLGAGMSAGHNTFILSDVFASEGQGNNLRLGEDYQMLMYTVMGDAHGALSNASYYNDGMLPGIQFAPGAWTCLEVLLDSRKPEIDVWVDGVEIPDLHHTDYPLDDYDNLRFGFEKYAGPATDVWYDDIAVGTQPIGCE